MPTLGQVIRELKKIKRDLKVVRRKASVVGLNKIDAGIKALRCPKGSKTFS